MKSDLAPGFLIAVPQLMDDNFDHSAILLLEHEEVGSLGVIINRPSSITLQEVFTEMGLVYSGPAGARVLIGGPVEPNRGIVIHAEGNEPGDSHPVTERIYVGTTPASLSRLFNRDDPRALFVLGHAGWGPGQLDREIEAGFWVPAPLDESLIFDADRQSLWSRVLQQIGIDPRQLVRGGSESGVN